MKRKIIVLILTMLMCLTAIVIIPHDFETEANSGESGGKDGDGKSNGFDYDYIWSMVRDICNVTHEYPPSMIPKGRAFGTWGEHYAANDIIAQNMSNIGLYNITLDLVSDINNWTNLS